MLSIIVTSDHHELDLIIFHIDATDSQKSSLEHIIRKCAHFSIYFLGGFIIYNLFSLLSLLILIEGSYSL